MLPRPPEIGREFEIALPYVRVPLTKNQQHRMHHMQASAIKSSIIRDVRYCIRGARVPYLERGDVTLTFYPGKNQGPDPDGIAPTLSAALDAAVHEGVFTDDSAKYVLESRQRVVLRREDPYDRKSPRLILTIRERLESE